MNDEQIIEEMQNIISPPTMLELDLGRCLWVLRDAKSNPGEYTSEHVENVEAYSDELLEIWSNKYYDYVVINEEGNGENV